MKRVFGVMILTLSLASPAAGACLHTLLGEAKAPLGWVGGPVDERTIAAFEAEMERVVRATTDEELRDRIAAAMRTYIRTQGYLPGLTDRWKLETLDELVADIPEAKRAYGGSRLGNYLGNLEQTADTNRAFLKLGKGDQPKYIRDWFRAFTEASSLRELIRRAP